MDSRDDLATGAELIAAERLRQVEAEGWTWEHDRGHGSGRLRMAGWAYETDDPTSWPWDAEWWKPKGPLRNLVRAGALYQAAADVEGSDYARGLWLADRDRVATQIDALLAEVRTAGWVPGELLAAEQARNATLTDTAERLRVRLHSIHDLWREWQHGEYSATEVEPGIAYCADRLGALLATDEEGPA